MSELIDSIIKTRETTADIFAKVLINIGGLSEKEVAEKILSEVKNFSELYPEGWYNPPLGGVGILFDEKPFRRLAYDSLRKPEYSPKENLRLEKESVGLVYFSPINRKTNMIGDIGFTLYVGDNQEIKDHIKNSYSAILEIAQHAQVGMKFPELCEFANNSFQGKFSMTKWATVNYNKEHSTNLGHTIPGSFEDNFTFGSSFEEIKESIKTKRIAFAETENFEIPKTCAFTVETRLSDISNPDLPTVYFHFIVCFDNGKKTILENFSEIFEAVGMSYMNTK